MATTKPKFAGLPDDQVIQSALDKAHQLTAKLEALLSMACGTGGDALRAMDPALQDAYMFACSDMATELKECVSALDAP